MIIFILFFIVASSATTATINTVYANTAAIYSILVVCIFLSLLLTFLRETRRLAWIGFALVVLLYASIDFLAPYTGELSKAIAALLALLGVLLIKRPMWRFVKKNSNTLPGWSKWVLRLI